MLWLLSLFPVFRQIENDLQLCRTACEELSTEKLMLQDRLEMALADKESLWTAMQDALTNERYALRMQVNHAVQKAGGGIPYPDAHSLPSDSVHPIQVPGPVGRRGRVLPSEAAFARTQQFMDELLASNEKH